MRRYYLTQRPPMPGAFPKPVGNAVINVVSFDERVFVSSINHEAWGYVEYEYPLLQKDVEDYELVEEAGTKSLMKRLLDAGYPKSKMFHHQSDLYIFVNEKTTRIINEWCAENGFNPKWSCPKFTDEVTGKPMYDCAFQYSEEDEDAE